MQTTKLRNGANIPLVGFGTFLIEPKDATNAVKMAIGNGYRHIDTAQAYGNEHEVGQGIAQSGVARSEIFVTTKLWQGGYGGQPALDSDGVKRAFENSYNALNIGTIDLYLIHSPHGGARRIEQWRTLLELRNQGLIRTVGVSNFSVAHLQEIERAGLELPEVNQIELHPWSQKPELVAFMRERGILPIAYSSLAPLSSWRAGQEKSARSEAIEHSDIFAKMAAKYGVSEAQLLLRWGVQMGYPVLPKSLNSERQKQNLDLFSFEIDAADMAILAAQDKGDGLAWQSGDPSKID